MNELKRTDYSYMIAGVVASRDQLCILDSLTDLSNTEKAYACDALNKKAKPKDMCCYRRNEKYDKELMGSILDIEDLDRIGKKEKICPYYLSKKMEQNADVIFMPYNYILDPKVRDHMDIDLENAIIILDEGHNVEKMCEDSACTLIDSSKIRIALRDLNYVNVYFSLCKCLV